MPHYHIGQIAATKIQIFSERKEKGRKILSSIKFWPEIIRESSKLTGQLFFIFAEVGRLGDQSFSRLGNQNTKSLMKNFNNMNMKYALSYQPVLQSRCFQTSDAMLPLGGNRVSNKRKRAFC